MNKAKLKTYAPQARKDFIAAVTQRANLLGLSDSAGKFEALPAERRGDVVLIAGREWPARVAQQRERLVRRIQRDGFGYTMEAVAYTWFNRFAALRFMELHDYLGHGHRVLSSASAGGLPDILAHAADLAASRELPGLDAAHIAELKLAGNKDGELYRLLLVAQCNALSAAMPFLFERIDDETELLLPDNLLRTDAVIAKLVAEIPEEDWAEVEIIGWLYQFYISEKKDQVIGKVVKSEDIPAATQLFTPNWIVQYLMQNSVGRLWLMANPASTLASQWPYYIQPAEQTPDVGAALAAITQTRIDEDGGSLNPESITVLDPACGSGHILVEAYALLKGIYLERGYRLRDIPRLILEKNLYGLDIDDRAAQLAGFALLMKARADDRRLFNDPPRLNVLSLQESKGLDLDELATHLAPFGVQRGTVKVLLDTFEHAKTFGSLIQIPDALNAQLRALAEALEKANETGDLYAQAAAQDLMALVEQAKVLGRKFDAVVANPPYMGGKGMNGALKEFAKATFPDSKSDLFAMFIERGFGWCKANGFNSMVTMQSWMFLSSYEATREKLLEQRTIQTMAHLGARAFAEISGEVVQTTAFVLQGQHFFGFKPTFFRLVDGQEADKEAALRSNHYRFDTTAQDDFKEIPGSPVAYWVSDRLRHAFPRGQPLRKIAEALRGVETGNNEKFLRQWQEVDRRRFGTNLRASSSDYTWYPYNKGGGFKKWFGNRWLVINWHDNGNDIKGQPYPKEGRLPWRAANEEFYFKDGLTWGGLTTGTVTFRTCEYGAIFDSNKGSMMFPQEVDRPVVLGFLNTVLVSRLLNILNPTLSTQKDDIGNLPFFRPEISGEREITKNTLKCVDIAKADEYSYEGSWDFQILPVLTASPYPATSLESSYVSWVTKNRDTIAEMKGLEEENNRLFIDAYGLADELSPEVPIDQITLTVNPAYRYGGNLTEDEQRTRFRQDSMAELISYAIGCMMGRYSLDEPGLIYAHAGNVGFDPTRYQTFPADADGIVPITDEFWFEDDAAHRVREFLRAAWGADTLDENMAWLAESLGAKANETPDETIRRYLADKFFKDHLQTYKKRPIYWLFSSGKQGAFQALVYLHRYHEGTLARLRAEYVVPLTGKMQARIDMLEKDATAAPSTAARNKLNKQLEKLRKKHVELLAYDEKLRHYADMRIQLDLDDGVKANYGKFGDLLAEVKAVTGGASDD
ncbi:BREX-1 system adenine-specific DNA-methyltransferase PglX [Thauera aromatica]|uniref:BREX-1 system adenine-specific DNA-methyltransferase PglX n=1 Tax=Thauera aromatica TaxID=59405 RepID=UPI001FFC4840|nr:BREX-1 system adenine-specific DNA-methyltransferase PglX [Thauera aromatica]MCK2088678.1 BREX-1 system adenine-specific DNA-methyltransferase PglX [Thauera aromatica]